MPIIHFKGFLLDHIAAELNLSKSHVRATIRTLGMQPVKRISNVPIYSAAQVRQIKKRDTKPGPKRTKK